jgi:hypothetical protein
MDCERIAAESPPGGPTSWEVSERAIRGYCERLLAHGCPPTLFLTPECAAQHAAMLCALAERGVELALHVHPQSLGDGRHTRYLGEYGPDEQREILDYAAGVVSRATGARPRSFRPGNFSASDATYPTLYALGFRQGSVSDPGRRSPQYAAEWVNAPPDPHYVDPADRLRAGDLPFLEVPVTTDPARRRPNGFPYELRVESGSFAAWHQPIIEGHLRRLDASTERRATPPVRALCLFTHNTFAYDDPEARTTVTLGHILDHVDLLARTQDVVPVTLADMHTRVAP